MKRGSRRRLIQGGAALAGLGLLAGCRSMPPWVRPAAAPRIGFLGATTEAAEAARVEAFRQGLGELGYAEGQTLIIEWRWADGQFDRLPALAADLVRLDVDAIVAGGATSARAAQGATTTIAIVMAQAPDPVGSGLVAGLARPGGNVTGLSQLAPEVAGKRLELLRAIVPTLARLGVIGSSTAPGNDQSLRETERAATVFGLRLHHVDAPGPEDIEAAFRDLSNGRADAVAVLGGPALILQRTRVAELAARYRLPATYNSPEHVVDGGLMSYSVSIIDLYRRTATYVDKILKGAKPADLPVEQPTSFELVVNLKSAQALGLTIPPSVLQQATEIIR